MSSNDVTEVAATQVDFYHLHSDSVRQMQLFCCRLVDKAWQLGHTVCILAADAEQASQLDDLLWTWRDDSFLPHGLAASSDSQRDPVIITHTVHDVVQTDLLVNVGNSSITEHASLIAGAGRIAEIINQDPFVKQQGRIRYSYYDKAKYSLKYHEITSG